MPLMPHIHPSCIIPHAQDKSIPLPPDDDDVDDNTAPPHGLGVDNDAKPTNPAPLPTLLWPKAFAVELVAAMRLLLLLKEEEEAPPKEAAALLAVLLPNMVAVVVFLPPIVIM